MFIAHFEYKKKEPQIMFFKADRNEAQEMNFKADKKNTIKFKINKNFKLGVEN